MDIKMRKTEWIVITGAPCSGKTSVVSSLELRGYRVVHEAARAYIDELLTSGKSLQEIKADPLLLKGRFFIENLLSKPIFLKTKPSFWIAAYPTVSPIFYRQGWILRSLWKKAGAFVIERFFIFKGFGFKMIM
jgi:hypothetical protein